MKCRLFPRNLEKCKYLRGGGGSGSLLGEYFATLSLATTLIYCGSGLCWVIQAYTRVHIHMCVIKQRAG